MRAIALAALLIWLSFFGGSAAWNFWPVLMVNLSGGVVVIWLARRYTLVPAHLIFLLALTASTLLSGPTPDGFFRVGIWWAFLGVYYLADYWSDEDIQRAATLALLPCVVFALAGLENQNIVAFNLLGLALLAMPAWNLKIFGPTVLLLVNPLASVGGLLAAMVGALRYAARPGLLSLGLAPLLLLGWWFNPIGYAWRWRIWAEAWREFWSSPWVGVGLGNYQLDGLYWHAHNIIASFAAETGLIGLVGLAALAWWIIRRWSSLPVWAAAVVAAYGAWSLVDEPLRFFGAGFVFFLALSRGKDNENGLEVSKKLLEV